MKPTQKSKPYPGRSQDHIKGILTSRNPKIGEVTSWLGIWMPYSVLCDDDLGSYDKLVLSTILWLDDGSNPNGVLYPNAGIEVIFGDNRDRLEESLHLLQRLGRLRSKQDRKNPNHARLKVLLPHN